jgi:succinoglycan biosynthesis protein ExoA
MSEAVDISIVAPCRNEAKHIRAFLDSLLRQDFGGMRWEAIIADGMSTDGTRQIIESYRGRGSIRCIENPEKIVSTGLNRAIRMASGEYVIRMDVHTEYAPDYVRQCVAVLNETGAWNAGGPARTRAKGWMEAAIAACVSLALRLRRRALSRRKLRRRDRHRDLRLLAQIHAGAARLV